MEDLLSLNTISQKDEKLHTPGLADTAILGYCLLWVMLTEISVDIAVDSQLMVARWSVDSRSIVR